MSRRYARIDEGIKTSDAGTAVAFHSPECVHERKARDEDEGRGLHIVVSSVN